MCSIAGFSRPIPRSHATPNGSAQECRAVAMDGGGALHRGGARAAGIARHRDLGVIDMRQIAPTVAGILGVGLPAAGAAPLPVHP